MRLGRDVGKQLNEIGDAVGIVVGQMFRTGLRLELVERTAAGENEQRLESAHTAKVHILGKHIADHEHTTGHGNIVLLDQHIAQCASRFAQNRGLLAAGLDQNGGKGAGSNDVDTLCHGQQTVCGAGEQQAIGMTQIEMGAQHFGRGQIEVHIDDDSAHRLLVKNIACQILIGVINELVGLNT